MQALVLDISDAVDGKLDSAHGQNDRLDHHFLDVCLLVHAQEEREQARV